MCCSGCLFNRSRVFARHAGNGFDTAFDISREATLLIGRLGDGIEAVTDLGD